MKVEVIAYGYLMTLIGGKKNIELEEDAGLEDLVAQLAPSLGAFKKGYVGPYKLSSDLIVLINGRNAKTLTTKTLKDGDVVTLIPPLVGG